MESVEQYLDRKEMFEDSEYANKLVEKLLQSHSERIRLDLLVDLVGRTGDCTNSFGGTRIRFLLGDSSLILLESVVLIQHQKVEYSRSLWW